MRKITLFLLLFVCCSVFAVQAEKPIRYGVVGGLNLSYWSVDTDNITGFHVGGKIEYNFAKRLYLESGLLFTRKGYTGTSVYYPENDLVVKATRKHHYLEVPIHIGLKFNTKRDVSFFLSAGGYLGLGLFGKLKNKGKDYRASTNLYSSGLGDKRFDCGLGFKGGVELFKRVQLSVSYDWGLIGAIKDYNGSKNRNAMFSCAYMF